MADWLQPLARASRRWDQPRRARVVRTRWAMWSKSSRLRWSSRAMAGAWHSALARRSRGDHLAACLSAESPRTHPVGGRAGHGAAGDDSGNLTDVLDQPMSHRRLKEVSGWAVLEATAHELATHESAAHEAAPTACATQDSAPGEGTRGAVGRDRSGAGVAAAVAASAGGRQTRPFGTVWK